MIFTSDRRLILIGKDRRQSSTLMYTGAVILSGPAKP